MESNILSNIWQIFYDEKTKASNWPEFSQYDNTGRLDCFFENTPLYKLLICDQHLAGGYFGLLSPMWQFKAMGVRPGVEKKLLIETLERNPDLLAFNRRAQQLNSVNSGKQVHGEAFGKIYDILFPEFKNVKKQRAIIYMNYVIAKPEIWDRYKAFFVPLYERLQNAEGELKNLLWTDAKYVKKLPEQAKQTLGVNYYPMHTFICERFWGIFLEENRDIQITAY